MSSDREIHYNPQGKFEVVTVADSGEPPLARRIRLCLMILTTVSTLAGLCLVGAAGFFWGDQAKYNGLFSSSTLGGALGAGIALSLINGAGNYALFYRQFKLLAVFAGVSLALMTAVLAILGYFEQYVNVVESVGTGGLAAYSVAQSQVNDYVLSIYMTCCVDNPTFCPYVSQPSLGYLYCPSVGFCGAPNVTSLYCFQGAYTSPVSDPPVKVLPEFCLALQSAGIVGSNRDLGQCGANQNLALNGPPAFFAQFYSFVLANINFPVIAFAVLATLTGLEGFFSLALLWEWHRMDTGLYTGRKIENKQLKVDEAFEEQMHASVRASMHDWYQGDEDNEAPPPPTSTRLAPSGSVKFASPGSAKFSIASDDSRGRIASVNSESSRRTDLLRKIHQED